MRVVRGRRASAGDGGRHRGRTRIVVTAMACVLAGAAFGPTLASAAHTALVSITNDPDHPVPVAGSVSVGNLPSTQRVNGTVDVGNVPLPVSQQGTSTVAGVPASKHDDVIVFDTPRPIGPLAASTIVLDMRPDAHVTAVDFFDGSDEIFRLIGPEAEGAAYQVVPLTQPIPISSVQVECTDNVNCEAEVFAVGS